MSVRWPSFAKVNLHLQVVGRRPDGYHELRTIFQTIDLADEVTVELTAGPGVELEVEEGEAPPGRDNLAWRAAAGFVERWSPGAGVRVGLRKRIPVGGGLGGGSSNAATVLLALQELAGRPAPAAALWELARELGADVPFFLVGGTALGVGRGDEVVPLPDLPPRELLVVVAPQPVATPQAFAAVTHLTGKPLDPRILAIAQGGYSSWEGLTHGVNDLEAVVFAGWPRVAEVYGALVESGAEQVRLSGSGAAVFARFTEPPLASSLAERLPPGSRSEWVWTLGRQELARRRGGSRGGGLSGPPAR